MDDEDFMRIAIELARRSIGEDDIIHPKVGVVIVKDGEILAKASRNGNERGSHAEYLAFKKAAESGVDIKGATVYTTLEPCVYRNTKYTPCADHTIERGISRVVVGITDPNLQIKDKGISLLQGNGIEVSTGTLEETIAGFNSAFIEKHQKKGNFWLVKKAIEEYQGMPGTVVLSRLNPPTTKGDYIALLRYESFLGLVNGLDRKTADLITKAFMFSLEHHDGQIHGGYPDIPYSCHTTMVAETIFGFGYDSPSNIILGLWHDLLEDTHLKPDDLEHALTGFGMSTTDVSELVDGIKKLDSTQYEGDFIESTKRYYENLITSGIALVGKGADLLVNLKRSLNNWEYLSKTRPHLPGKYIFVTERFLPDGTFDGVSEEIPYRLARVKGLMRSEFDEVAKSLIIDRSAIYGPESQNVVREFLHA